MRPTAITFFLSLGIIVLLARPPIVFSTAARIDPPVAPSFNTCSCGSVGDLSNRLKGVEAALQTIASAARGPAGTGSFDAGTFDSGIGEDITRSLATAGGINSMVIGDIDRYSCEIDTGPDLSGVPGAPAGIGGSACLKESLTAQLNVRRQACLAAQSSSNQGNDYWEGRQMSAVLRELTDSYSAEAQFLKQQIARLATICGGARAKVAPPPPQRNICRSCVQYLMEGTRTLPVVGTIKMSANEIINFDIEPDSKISGTATINTELDTSGSPCTFSGYDGVAEINVTGEVHGGFVNAVITPKGNSQRTSAAMSITCPPGGRAEVFPVQQNYAITESLKVPLPGQRYTEKRIDLSSRTMGAMQGYIILRLFISPRPR